MQFPLALRTVLIAAPLLLAGPACGAVPLAAAGRGTEPALGAYLAGTVASHLGDGSEAADLLLDALAHDPGETTLLNPTFLVSTLAGRPQATALAARVEPSLIARLVLANDAVTRGDWATASRDFTDLPPSPLDDALRPLLLAWAQQGGGDTDQALQTLAAVPGGGPLTGACALHAAMIADLAGRTPTASSLYRTAQALFPGAGLSMTQALGSFLVRNGDAAGGRAMVHALTQQISVIGMVEPGLVASLRHPAVADARQGLAQAYLAIGAMMQEQGPAGKDAATFMLRFALDLQPDLVAAQLMMADLLVPGRSATALRILAASNPSDPLSPLVALRAATLLATSGQRAAGQARLAALVRQFPDRPEPAQALGDVLADGKLYAEAVQFYDKAIADRVRISGQGSAQGSVRGSVRGLAGNDWQLLFSRAVALDRQDLWPRAEADLQHALALAPGEPFVLNYLGYSLVERHQDLGQARQLIQRALDGKPDDGSIRDSLGWVMLRQDDVPDAVRTLERAAEQMPEDPTVNYHLGAAYWAAGRANEAEDQWRWALLLHPEPADAARIRDSLRRAGIVLPASPAAAAPR